MYDTVALILIQIYIVCSIQYSCINIDTNILSLAYSMVVSIQIQIYWSYHILMQNTHTYSYHYIFVLLFFHSHGWTIILSGLWDPHPTFSHGVLGKGKDCVSSGGTVMVLSKFLKRNITIVSPEDMWSAEDTSADIVCGYLSSERYIPIIPTAQPEVGTYFLIHI